MHDGRDNCVEEIRLSRHRVIPAIVLVCLLVAAGACWHSIDLARRSEVYALDRIQRAGEGVIVHGHIVDTYHIYRLSRKLMDKRGK